MILFSARLDNARPPLSSAYWPSRKRRSDEQAVYVEHVTRDDVAEAPGRPADDRSRRHFDLAAVRELAQTLVHSGLVREYVLVIHPSVLAREGRPSADGADAEASTR
jgi:hypothetical protein